MSNYAVIKNALVINTVTSDSDYAQTQGWVLLTDGAGIGWSYIDGQFVAPMEQEQTQDEIMAAVVNATQRRLDDFAKTRGYDGILSLCTYATSTVLKFQAEGKYGVEARDATWAKLYEIMAEVEANNRSVPNSFKDIENELPILQWPNEVLV